MAYWRLNILHITTFIILNCANFHCPQRMWRYKIDLTFGWNATMSTTYMFTLSGSEDAFIPPPVTDLPSRPFVSFISLSTRLQEEKIETRLTRRGRSRKERRGGRELLPEHLLKKDSLH